MKKKLLTWIVTALFFVPCFVFLTACTGAKETGFKIVIDDQSYTADNGNEIVLDEGAVLSYSAVAILDDDSEKTIDSSLLTVIDEDSIIGTELEAGEYELTFKYADYPEIVVSIVVNASVENMAIPTASVTEFTYNGSQQTLTIANFDSTKMSVTGNTATDAGSYTATISLLDKTHTKWVDDTTTDITINWTINKLALAKPTKSSDTYTYNTEDQNLVLVGFDADTMTKVSGCTGKNANDYDAVIALKDTDNYMWADESTTNVTIDWTIEKAQAVAPSHSALSGIYNPAKTLADYTLTAGYSWTDASIVPTVSNNTYNAIYNPDPNNYESDETTITLNIAKAQAVAPVHAVLTGVYDEAKTLANYTLENGFEWDDDTIIPEVNTTTYTAKYNPDADNYLDAEVEITLNISKAQAVAPAHATITGTYDEEKTLADYALDNGFAWVDDTIVPDTTTTVADATYNPDPDNYLDAEVEIAIDIAAKSPVVTFKYGLDKAYDGLSINNPRVEISEDVEYSYQLFSHNGESWNEEPIENTEIVEVGKYKIVVNTVAKTNYAAITHEEEFFIYYDVSKLYIVTDSEHNQYTYTGSEIYPAVYVVLGVDGEGEPIFLDGSMYDIEYYNNINYFDNTYFTVTGNNDLCRGTYTDSFYINPENILSHVQVGSTTIEVTDNYGIPVEIDSVPTDNVNVKLTLGSLYANDDVFFTFIPFDEDYKALAVETIVPDSLEFVVPKETRNIQINFNKGSSSTSVPGIYFNINTSEEKVYAFDYIGVDNVHINNIKFTIVANNNFTGDLFAAIEDAMEAESYTISWGLTEAGYTYDSVAQNGNQIIFTFKADGKEDIVVTYNIIATPEENSCYLYLHSNIDGLYIDGDNNTVDINVEFTGDLDTAITSLVSDPNSCYANSDFAYGYAYSSFAIANDKLTITLTKTDSPNIVVTYDIVDYTKKADTFISNIHDYNELFENISINLENQVITLHSGFDGDVVEILNSAYAQGLIELETKYNESIEDWACPFSGLQASANGDKVLMTVTYTPFDTSDEVEFTFEFAIEEVETYCNLLSFTHVDMYSNREFLTFDNNNSITITKTMNATDTFYLSFNNNGGITNWVITNSEGEEVVSYATSQNSMGYPNNVTFENIPGADTYTLTVYRGALTDVYTIVIENFDDTPYFKFTYDNNDYIFSMDSTGNIFYCLNMNTFSPEYLYTYLGSIADGVENIQISISSLVQTGYDQDMVEIADFNNVQLKVLTDESGNKYSLMYGSFEGNMIPIYLYHYDKVVETGVDYKFQFANKDIKFSMTPTYDEELEMNFFGDFIFIDDGEDSMFATQITKSQIGYVDGDSTVNFKVNINDLNGVLVLDMEGQSILMGIADHSGYHSAPVSVIEGGETITYIMFIVSDMNMSSYIPLMIQIIDDPIE